ncbi:hypothetical protein [Paractinoplanes brasiliensis]|uniref:Galactose oxidase-like protein n=1 Tax=Paractinoplanes brasiliensis TaxID=52695 RepID=A0A4R6J8C0_9ACTN|nr:hypothetical protein [Actinoplanes brasiliensis]TDO31702.1 galactose oxidase-like protein [Actinoplanes brasiliensis]GID30704.1 hypothetical protein Abr02nite_56870 [Actinoplanes brasiliensis]
MRLVAGALSGVLLLGACATGSSEQEARREGWRQVSAGPLGPREQALGLWTGREVLLIGGAGGPPCPPNASCATDPTPLTDAAALDPGTNGWRTIAAPPVPTLGAQGVVLGSTAFVLPYGSRRELLVYRVDRDAWSRLPTPFDPARGFQLVAAGNGLVAYGGTDEAGPGDDFLLDPGTGTWTTLPADPLGPAFDRSMAWTGSELALFEHELVPNPGADGPSLTRAALLDLDSRSWRRLPDLPMLRTGPWLATGDELVNPTLGGADGGQVGNWGRSYPNGGIVDPATGAWSPLPDPPGGHSLEAEALGGGARTGTAALYPGPADAVLDTVTNTWERPGDPSPRNVTGRTVVAAGAAMVIFGGARWDKDDGGTLLDDTWIWTPGR